MSVVLFPNRRSDSSPLGLEDFDLGGTAEAVRKLFKIDRSLEVTRSESKISIDILQAPIQHPRARLRMYQLFAKMAVDGFRLVPGPDYRVRLAEIEVGEQRTPYLLKKSLVKDLRPFVSTWVFVARDFGTEEPSVWGLNEAALDASSSAIPALAKRYRTAVVADYSAGVLRIEADLTDKTPVRKPSVPFAELVLSFFGRRVIRSLDHPVVRDLLSKS